MEHSASLFDLGLHRLPRNYALAHHAYRAESNNPRASLDLNWEYEQAAHQISGWVYVYDDTSDEPAMQSGCEELLRQLTIWVVKTVPQAFLPGDWVYQERAEQTQRITDELKGMVTLSCSVYADDKLRYSKRITPWRK
jgi:hypothetical protein